MIDPRLSSHKRVPVLSLSLEHIKDRLLEQVVLMLPVFVKFVKMLTNGFQVFYCFYQQLLQVDHFASTKVEKRLEAIAEVAALDTEDLD